MDKGLVITTIVCITILAFFVGYQLSISGLPRDASTDNGDDWDSSIIVDLTLKGDLIEVSHSQPVAVKGSRATILFGGTYNITGSLSDGQIAVYTDDEDPVRLILHGVNINCSTSAPISIMDAEEAFIILADGTENFVGDTATYVYYNPSQDEPNAAVFCKSDLTIMGNGVLNVIGNYNDGIASKDGLVIQSGTVNVRSVDDGIRGRDYIVVKSGVLDLDVGGDGLKSDNPENATLGNISVENGTINIVSGGDAFQAEKEVLITGGSFNLKSGGGSSSVATGNVSTKGIKGLVSVIIDGGVFEIDSADDALHSNGTITVNEGSLILSSGDDAIHADGSVEINGGDINVARSVEGIEGAVITINGGDISIVSSNDGVDAVVSAGTSSTGVVSVENGVIDVRSGGDAIQAGTNVLITDGSFNLVSGGGSLSIVDTGFSAKGIKGVDSVTINSGTFLIDSADDTIHSNGNVMIAGGSFTLLTGDDAIHADGTIEVNGGNIDVTKSSEGIEGVAVTINDGSISIISSDDGIDAMESLVIEKGVINIRSGGDAIQAGANVLITDGSFNLVSGGGSLSSIGTAVSAKGIKAAVSVTINGGVFVINSADDAVHSDGTITVNGGSLVLSTADDGMRAGSSISINNGNIEITESYEGIESDFIVINGGNIHITSSDDGVNVGPDAGPPRIQGPGRGSVYYGSHYLYINGGYLAVNALGDGLDSNGAIVMNGGQVIVDGPSYERASALDHGAFNMTGGYLLAVSSSGMALAPGSLSTQYTVFLNFESANQGGTLVHVQTSDGTEVFTFMPTRQYQSVVFSSPSLALGSTYDVYLGGSHTGTIKDGLYTGGTYTPGTKYTSFTISTMVTQIGEAGWAWPPLR